jgi:hypothetical protein
MFACLFVYWFTFRAGIFHLYGDVTIAGERLQNVTLSSTLRTFERAGDLYRATLAVTRGLGFSNLIRRAAPFSRLLLHTRGCGGSILSRILTGPCIKCRGNVLQLFYIHVHVSELFSSWYGDDSLLLLYSDVMSSDKMTMYCCESPLRVTPNTRFLIESRMGDGGSFTIQLPITISSSVIEDKTSLNDHILLSNFLLSNKTPLLICFVYDASRQN